MDKLVQVLVFGCGDRRIADHTCSATTLRRRRDEWISAGPPSSCAWRYLAAYDRMLGLSLEQLAVDGCTSKAPCGGHRPPGPSPVDRRKQGLKCSVAVEAGGSPLARCPPRPTTATTGCWRPPWTPSGVVGPLPERPVVHLDAGYDYQPCRQVLAERGMVGQIATRGGQHRSRLGAGG